MWKSKKDLKIKELEHTIRHLHAQLQSWQGSSEHYRKLKNDYKASNERLRREKKWLSESILNVRRENKSLKLELSKYKNDVATLIKHIDTLEGDKNNEK